MGRFWSLLFLMVPVLGVEPLPGAPAPGADALPPAAPLGGSDSDAVHASASVPAERAASTSVEGRAAEVLMIAC